MIDLIEAQKELIEKHWPAILNSGKQLDNTSMMIHAIVKELSELSDGYACFPWSKPVEIDREYILEEITDVLHFLLELYILWGVTSMEEVEELYMKKRNKNLNERGKVHYYKSN
jgi:dimeric dUTPase (all-alpha-NTP-PPase superfamily)